MEAVLHHAAAAAHGNNLHSARNSGEQLDDECQLWGRALRIVSARLASDPPSPRDRISWAANRGICLPLGVSRSVRTALLQLCSEAEERQANVDRLEESERHLSADLRYSQEKIQLYREQLATQQQQKVAAATLDSARSSAYLDSVPNSLLLSEREQELINSKSVANNRAKALETKVDSQEAEIRRLRKKLLDLERVEAERHARQQEVFRSFKNRKPTRHSPLDNKLLDIIDSYEMQLQRLRLQLDGLGASSFETPESADVSEDTAVPGRGYRVTIEQLHRQIASLSDQVQCLENEREVLCTELEARPTNSDHVLLASKLHRYERLLKKHNIDASKDAAAARDFSTRVEDVDLLPLSLCQRLLRDAARLLNIEDFKQMKEAITDLVSISDAYGIVHPILIKAQDLTQGEGAPPLPSELTEQLLSGSDKVQLLIPALEHWRDQLVNVPELHRSLERMFMQLYPWSSLDRLLAGPDVRKLIAAADRMASDENYELAPPSEQRRESGLGSSDSHSSDQSHPQPPHSMLLGLVEHFRKLFDVAQVSGVCTKMNSVYAELGICRNAMNSIKEALGLVEQTPMEAVVNAVGRLMQLERLAVNEKLLEIFNHEDVQLALERLDEYDQFFPVFEGLVKNLMEVLAVSRVDDILPLVAAHKSAFDSQVAQQA